jgi:adhesin transport system outer membrane protein
LSGADEAKAKLNSVTEGIEVSKKDLTDKIRSDYNLYQTSTNQEEVLQELVSSSASVYESYVRQFTAGRKTWQEVLNARKEATQAKYSLVDSRWSGIAAVNRIKIFTGEIRTN